MPVVAGTPHCGGSGVQKINGLDLSIVPVKKAEEILEPSPTCRLTRNGLGWIGFTVLDKVDEFFLSVGCQRHQPNSISVVKIASEG